jgi:hypothetical protein
MKRIVLGAVAAFFLAACGGPDNVGNCQKLIEKVKCGTVDLSSAIRCEEYQQTACDLGRYFDCVASHYQCVNGAYDTNQLAKQSGCNSLAICP